MSFIKNIVGKLTRPASLHANQCGETWVSCAGMPDLDKKGNHYINHDYRFTYRRAVQNSLGKWGVQNCWLGLNNPLPVFNP